MEPFWADPLHRCDGCGAFDIGLYPERCKCDESYESNTSAEVNIDFSILVFFVIIGVGIIALIFFIIGIV